ncbi:DoxX family protein [Mycobacterium intermedium]|uniref:DoxX family protein n=1 Tax=Mycobacterium intermedium TaxID=28445 RepID=A0A1E3S6M3_MYCIE|nr:DoxX family protein [Mycobacterium intermedium]MCV6966060.1 DoxX family protein [Mycobacterium intermedium]ODQ97292.1 DoxX family protein [Mycobacterium intermedium]OPE47028.1 DoxX family protein [Mycobacterium intermedium]ORA96424.1 DoxX family protein [Mycobacterium intermedium]
MLIRRIARPMLSAVFISQGVDSLLNPKPAAEAAKPTVVGLQSLPEPVSSHIPPDAEQFAQINAAVQIGGGLLLATGRLPRVASAALALTVIPGNLGAHMFWNEADPERKREKRREFITDVSLLGGLIIAAADTGGKPSLGWRGRRAAERLSERVSGALPGSSHDALLDAELADRIVHSLHVGAERGRELASTAAEKSAPYAEAALERGRELANVAAERSAPIAKKARRRGRELAITAAERTAPLAEEARKRSEKFASTARVRGVELAETARHRGSHLADTAAARGSELADRAAARGSELAYTARDRFDDQLADLNLNGRRKRWWRS